MSKFLRHESCDNCGSSDAKGIFDDGHTYCWSCQHRTNVKITSSEQVANILLPESQQNSVYELPYDVIKNIPKLPYSWLKGYGVTNEEIVKYNLMWSESRQMLIFPFYENKDYTKPVYWQGRYFPARKPKVFTSGFPDRHVLYRSKDGKNDNSRIVVVEDSISAIKVARFENSIELLGSNLSLNKAVALSKQFKKIVFWLDEDKYRASVGFSYQFCVLFEHVDIIYSTQDPKDHTSIEIQEILDN